MKTKKKKKENRLCRKIKRIKHYTAEKNNQHLQCVYKLFFIHIDTEDYLHFLLLLLLFFKINII